MTRKIALRLCELLTERGLSHSMGTQGKGPDNFTVIWWEHSMGEQHLINSASLVHEQTWLEREVIK